MGREVSLVQGFMLSRLEMALTLSKFHQSSVFQSPYFSLSMGKSRKVPVRMDGEFA